MNHNIYNATSEVPLDEILSTLGFAKSKEASEYWHNGLRPTIYDRNNIRLLISKNDIGDTYCWKLDVNGIAHGNDSSTLTELRNLLQLLVPKET